MMNSLLSPLALNSVPTVIVPSLCPDRLACFVVFCGQHAHLLCVGSHLRLPSSAPLGVVSSYSFSFVSLLSFDLSVLKPIDGRSGGFSCGGRGLAPMPIIMAFMGLCEPLRAITVRTLSSSSSERSIVSLIWLLIFSPMVRGCLCEWCKFHRGNGHSSS